MRIRRVGFRHGTDEELTALHTVGWEVEAERRPDRVPQPLDAYIAFVRNLPVQSHDHTWVVEDAPMLAINDRLGFRLTATRTAWQADVRHLLDVL